MSKSVMIIDTPIDCCDCPFGTMAFGKSVCLLDEGNGIECPLKPYKDFVPMEWVKKWIRDYEESFGKLDSEVITKVVYRLLEDWEKDNEQNL